MSATIIDGTAIGQQIREELKAEVAELRKRGVVPGLTVVLVGEDPASQVYVRMKGKAADELGMKSDTIRLPADTPERELLALLDRLNADRAVHGILVQLPLPGHMDCVEGPAADEAGEGRGRVPPRERGQAGDRRPHGASVPARRPACRSC